MMLSFRDANNNRVSFQSLENDALHLYYVCGDKTFELVGPADKLLAELKFALDHLDLSTVEMR